MRKCYFLLLGLFLFGGVQAQIVNIPDANFKAKLLAASSSNTIAKDLGENYFKIDSNNDGQIQVSEALEVGFLNLKSSNILSVDGIQNFINIKSLNCSYNQLTSIDLKELVNLIDLEIFSNKLVSIDLSRNNLIERLYLSNNKIIDLNTDNLIGLLILEVNNCFLVDLNLNNNINLKNLSFYSNRVQNLFIKNGSKEGVKISSASLLENPNLRYICCNESQVQEIKNELSLYSFVKVEVNSYCSFTPGGTFYSIQGNAKLDSDNNGCDTTDSQFSNVSYNITNGTVSENIIAITTGNYAVPVQAGTLTITPVIENPNYFTVSPANTVVTFPSQTSPFTQDFCITANGVHSDLEVSALPTTRARAGFDVSYKIIYKNKGTNTQSGSVKLSFDDSVLDLVAANPVVASQNTNNLSWNFSDLKPFETREITVTVNINGPMETPAINGGDTLDYTATITSTLTDETPTDNTFTLNQTVVNAFDPNDKTCLEGATIPPSAVGKYVHYLIRFENKGTAEAQNVVVKDIIDTSKFDVNSLVVTQGSHSFVTRITETNKVEFIFENIYLPFDDAANDGYVAFKIKTKPSLTVGDSFSNTASIYFDYNFPIVTNTATTSVLQSLGKQDFEFDSYFTMYPNPAKNILNINVKKQINVSSISIYNTLGQQILVIPNAQQTKQVDISSLKTGNYFIKLTSDKGTSVGKFVKE